MSRNIFTALIKLLNNKILLSSILTLEDLKLSFDEILEKCLASIKKQGYELHPLLINNFNVRLLIVINAMEMSLNTGYIKQFLAGVVKKGAVQTDGLYLMLNSNSNLTASFAKVLIHYELFDEAFELLNACQNGIHEFEQDEVKNILLRDNDILLQEVK